MYSITRYINNGFLSAVAIQNNVQDTLKKSDKSWHFELFDLTVYGYIIENLSNESLK